MEPEAYSENPHLMGIFTIEGFLFQSVQMWGNETGQVIVHYTVSKYGYVICMYQHLTEVWKITGRYYPDTIREMAQLPNGTFISLTWPEIYEYNQIAPQNSVA